MMCKTDCRISEGDGTMAKVLGGAIGALVMLVVAMPSTALAANLAIPLDTTVTSGVAPGDRVELTVVSSGPLAGQTCDARSVRPGQGMSHPGNDLIVSSGEGRVALADVERTPDSVTEADGTITLADAITVELVMGSDGEFDGDVVVELDCDAAGATPSNLPVTGAGSTSILLWGVSLLLGGTGLCWLAGAGRHRPDAHRLR
jgi:hypothetical protein